VPSITDPQVRAFLTELVVRVRPKKVLAAFNMTG
jgi:hypothetical protein